VGLFSFAFFFCFTEAQGKFGFERSHIWSTKSNHLHQIVKFRDHQEHCKTEAIILLLQQKKRVGRKVNTDENAVNYF